MKGIAVYLASPLFTVAERSHNSRLERVLIEEGKRRKLVLRTTIPQRKALQRFRHEEKTFDVSGIVYDCIQDSINHDIILVNLDGPTADDGSSVELGIALGYRTAIERINTKIKKFPKIITYRTDFRTAPEKEVGVNAMLQPAGSRHVYHPCFVVEEKDFKRYYEELAKKLVDGIEYVAILKES